MKYSHFFVNIYNIFILLTFYGVCFVEAGYFLLSPHVAF